MVDAALFVRPGVAVRIEMDQRQRAVAAGMGLEQRVADEMVTAQGEHGATGFKYVLGMGLDTLRDRLRGATIESAVAVVDHCQMVERVEGPGPVARPGLLHRGGTDCARPETRPGAVAGGVVERHTADHHIHSTQVATVATTRETGNTCVGTFRCSTVQAVTGHGLVVVLGLFHGWAPLCLSVTGGYGRRSTAGCADAGRTAPCCGRHTSAHAHRQAGRYPGHCARRHRPEPSRPGWHWQRTAYW